MKFKFESNLEYQNEAIAAIVDIFKGIKTKDGLFSLSEIQQQIAFDGTETTGVGNQIITANWIETIAQENIEKIQLRNGLIESKINNNLPTFDVEMETGTGKTYVFLKTILKLSYEYDFKKFIIIVPSIAIKEGIKKTLQITKEHFKNLFPALQYNWSEYDASSLNTIKNFASNNDIEIMIMNIQAINKFDDENINKTTNVLYKNHDSLSGDRPIDLIKETNPIIIIDEPQSVSNGEKSFNAIKKLNPLFILRYSATFKKRTNENLVYKLDAIDAYRKKLVKEIVVYSQQLEYANQNGYIKLIDVDAKKSKAKIEMKILQENKDFTIKKIDVKVGDSLYEASNKLDEYQDLIVEEIIFTKDEERIILSNRKEYMKGLNDDKFNIHIKTAQIRETIIKHLDKQLEVKDKGIKVLSLFFIDQVKKYREYDENGNPILGQYANIFEEEFQKILKNEEKYRSLFSSDNIEEIAKQVHDGYFSIDKKNKFKDTNGTTLDDTSTYDKIMKDKEKLLSFNEKLSFIFSHSALKEGWDNPNVFQICTLNDSKSEIKKRQEIGRGLRLCVNQEGQRVHDKKINKLSIITNNSYQDFVENLQKELKEEGIYFGIIEPHTFSIEFNDIDREASKHIFNLLKDESIVTEQGKIHKKEYSENKIKKILQENTTLDESQINKINRLLKDAVRTENIINNGNNKRVNNIKMDVIISKEFQTLWNQICQKTVYKIEFDSDKYIKEVINKIKEQLGEIKNAQIISKKANISLSRTKGLEAKNISINKSKAIKTNDIYSPIPDLISDIEKSTHITRKTIVKILTSNSIIEYIKKNHEELKRIVIQNMIDVKKEMMVKGIEYKKIDNDYYEQDILKDNEKEIFFVKEKFVETGDNEKYPFEYIEVDSSIESKFAKDSLNSDAINKFIKLPKKFKIKTPLGTYNPDWALYTNEEITFIAETKGSDNRSDLRSKERLQIDCGKKHFEAISKDIRFKLTTCLEKVLASTIKEVKDNE